MLTKEIQINNKHGIHTRPATVFVENASKFKSEVHITYHDEQVNAKSIMGLLILAVEPGAVIQIEVEGPDEQEAMEKFVDIIENNFYME
ncbi:MAG: HPr family phosphocarrier protein [Candidatus Marinimicrobia bacterium]|nr:HPr family phosphocarrier protein [Candidatus Neomarinimicrobiota bacterium]